MDKKPFSGYIKFGKGESEENRPGETPDVSAPNHKINRLWYIILASASAIIFIVSLSDGAAGEFCSMWVVGLLGSIITLAVLRVSHPIAFVFFAFFVFVGTRAMERYTACQPNTLILAAGLGLGMALLMYMLVDRRE